MTSKEIDARKPLNVMFGAPGSSKISVPKNNVLIFPVADNWNDFGHRSKVAVHIHLMNETKESFYTRIGFIEEANTKYNIKSNGTKKLEDLFDGDKQAIPVTNEHKMFTMLPSMDAYRDIIKMLGLVDALAVLKSINDLVALQEFKKNKSFIEDAVDSDIFKKSFVRTSENYFTFKNAGSILRGLKNENIKNASQTLGINFRLAGKIADHNLKFVFDHKPALPKKIAVLIGKNGVGKSQALGRIADAALKGSKAFIDPTTRTRPYINRLLAFAPNDSNSVFPSGNLKRPLVWYRRFSLNRNSNSEIGTSASDLIIQVARSTESIKNNSRWEIFSSAISAIDNWQQLSLPLKGSGFAQLITLHDGAEQSLLERFGAVNLRKEPIRLIEGKGYPLSSGEISFLRFAAQASLYIENGSLLLLDEPETHLHPNFISQLVLLLENLLVKTGSSAIIATHSAYFVREVFPEQVSILSIDADGSPVSEQPSLSTFGANVGAISYFVFGEDEPSQLAVKVERKLLRKFKSWEDLYKEYQDQLSLELLSSLRAAMEKRKNNE